MLFQEIPYYSDNGTDIVNYNDAVLVYFADGSVAPGACN
ncbi:hypothetical protein LEP1GSC062_0928 [Leptospira alexanderi serovar Manhao 3 str. L 60]|uniref:Uncharacterized protein n=1 Tax=Leptospira alexanderi serovar Manhao 3 str. L 60 TaxID=1049759 RepID=V6IFJ4_9LEPT|nr:hypothetical protein LEP1GSC062_0928 [Leptospira alexanderi serovar Manhao 3 str. L 60]